MGVWLLVFVKNVANHSRQKKKFDKTQKWSFKWPIYMFDVLCEVQLSKKPGSLKYMAKLWPPLKFLFVMFVAKNSLRKGVSRSTRKFILTKNSNVTIVLQFSILSEGGLSRRERD